MNERKSWWQRHGWIAVGGGVILLPIISTATSGSYRALQQTTTNSDVTPAALQTPADIVCGMSPQDMKATAIAVGYKQLVKEPSSYQGTFGSASFDWYKAGRSRRATDTFRPRPAQAPRASQTGRRWSRVVRHHVIVEEAAQSVGVGPFHQSCVASRPHLTLLRQWRAISQEQPLDETGF